MIALAVAAEVARLVGQDVAPTPDGFDLRDVAGEGRPVIGVVERRGADLWVGDLRLRGPLAHPRIAGPGCKVWVLVEGAEVRARRIGVLGCPEPEKELHELKTKNNQQPTPDPDPALVVGCF